MSQGLEFLPKKGKGSGKPPYHGPHVGGPASGIPAYNIGKGVGYGGPAARMKHESLEAQRAHYAELARKRMAMSAAEREAHEEETAMIRKIQAEELMERVVEVALINDENAVQGAAVFHKITGQNAPEKTENKTTVEILGGLPLIPHSSEEEAPMSMPDPQP